MKEDEEGREGGKRIGGITTDYTCPYKSNCVCVHVLHSS